MAATPAWLAPLEAALNRNIAAQSRAAELLRRLEGKSVQLEVEGVLRIRAAARGGRLALLAGADSGADAVIGGTPGALLRLATALERPSGQGAVQVRGDAEVAGLYRELIALARPDLEEEAARLIGDVPARRLGVAVRRTRVWAERAGRSFAANLAEYLQEESRELVNKTEHEEFLRGVDELREAADRLEARLRRLEARLPGGG